MRYVINITKNKTSKDGSILGKVLDFKNEMTLHEQSELNVYKKHPQLTACIEKLQSIIDTLNKKYKLSCSAQIAI